MSETAVKGKEKLTAAEKRKQAKQQKYKNAIKLTTGEKVFDVFNIILLSLILLACAYPFYYIIINSVSGSTQLLIPERVSFYTYRKMLFGNAIPGKDSFGTLMKSLFDPNSGRSIGWSFMVSVCRVVIGVSLTVVVSSMFAYLVTQQKMFGRRFVYRFVTITMYLGAGLIPWYIMMKAYGFQNNPLLYVIPGMLSAYYCILIKTYIESLPISLEESAQLDGAGFFTIFFKIIFPLSKPIIATIAVFCAVGQWNAWSDNYFLITDPRFKTMQLVLYYYLTEAARAADQMKEAGGQAKEGAQIAKISSEQLQMTATIITVLPILCVYPYLQRYFLKGIMMGAVKG